MSVKQFFKNAWKKHEIAQQRRADFRLLQMMSDKEKKQKKGKKD